ncbi:hypothetical protein E2C01_045660 [Portunus trituberculatus]|uniref:Uncharacterized protein n=1 Tax=Portunus trituberculatus TaxID=210409 RepID=A0A5B7G1Z4_PORTR|nr:hypothetical protein [Portunus trituberculatus]
MVPELKDLTYEERLKEIEREKLITLYKIVNGIEKIDMQDLVLVTDGAGRTRGLAKKIRKRQCVKDIGK